MSDNNVQAVIGDDSRLAGKRVSAQSNGQSGTPEEASQGSMHSTLLSTPILLLLRRSRGSSSLRLFYGVLFLLFLLLKKPFQQEIALCRL
jgi:hypothetical protein